VDGVWRRSGQPRISGSLAEIVAARIGVLAQIEHTVVDLLALAEPLEMPTLAALSDPGAVERVEDLGLLTVDSEGSGAPVARLGHPLYGEVRRAQMGVVWARRLRGQLALTLDAARVLQRAVLMMGSDLTADVDLLMAGAHEAGQLCDLDLSERLAREALAAGGGFAAQLIVATSLAGRSRFLESEPEFEKLAALARTDSDLPHPGDHSFIAGPTDPVVGPTLVLPINTQISGTAVR
jgi:hypothetical protein